MITLTLDEFKSLTKSNPTVKIVDCFNKITILTTEGKEAMSIGRLSSYRADFN